MCIRDRNSIEHLFHNMTRAIGYLEQTRQWGLSARAYNLLAITSFNRGNAPFAMDYYLNGLFYCSKYHLYEEGCMICLLYTSVRHNDINTNKISAADLEW